MSIKGFNSHDTHRNIQDKPAVDEWQLPLFFLRIPDGHFLQTLPLDREIIQKSVAASIITNSFKSHSTDGLVCVHSQGWEVELGTEDWMR